MSDQLLPDFDGPAQPAEQPSPRKPKPRPQRKRPAKKKVVRAPSLKLAKRVPKKRRVRRTAMPGVLSATSEKALSPAFTPEAYRLIGLLMEQQWPIRALVISVVKGLSGK
jgi:hypothetical protein